ncbi:hypothetical protein MELE44368_11665 [Mycolicibacterium elephantis DSM 44368]|uniref:Uncharacterized protein n=1 Tax=Mycolicibacterium elephantis DSM 44368 TaxID=1335622 RepID=A0A439DYW7_9MYCO|nr:hypothetical protein MELE44368_11665 [Mycolicibacterium elephantis DSM 44368]
MLNRYELAVLFIENRRAYVVVTAVHAAPCLLGRIFSDREKQIENGGLDGLSVE